MNSNSFFKFDQPLTPSLLIRKDHRFVATCLLDGKEVRCFLPPPMPIGDFVLERIPCLLEENPPGRKTAYTVKAIKVNGRDWLGVDLNFSNKLVEYFGNSGKMDSLFKGAPIAREQSRGSSRLDFRAGDLWVEVKTPLSLIHQDTSTLALRSTPKPSKKVTEASLNPTRMERQVRDMVRALENGDRAAILTVHQYLPSFRKPHRIAAGEVTILETMEASHTAGLESWKLDLEFTQFGVRFVSLFQGRGPNLECPLCGERGHDSSQRDLQEQSLWTV